MLRKAEAIKVTSIKNIVIQVDNLTEEQQLKLWKNIWQFADFELPKETDLFCYIIKKNKDEH